MDTSRIYIEPDQDLTWSPKAPPPSFRINEGSWKMSSPLQVALLRAKAPKGFTRVALDDEGRTYYRPHWPLFTALIDAGTDAELTKAARDLGALPVHATAKEIGFPWPIALHLINKQAISTTDPKRTWTSDGPFLAYWSKLPKQERLASSDIEGQGWRMLDIALRSHQFLAAEQLWEHGHRFHPELAAMGTPAWALLPGLFSDIPSLDPQEHPRLDTAKMKNFLRKVAKEEQLPDKIQAGGPTNVLQRGFTALTQRWLGRMIESGVDFNATVQVNEAPGQDGKSSDRQAHRTPYMQSIVRPACEWPNQTVLANIWTQAMERGGYDFGAPVRDDFVKLSDSTTIVDYAQLLGMEEDLCARINESFLKARLDSSEPQAPRRKQRF